MQSVTTFGNGTNNPSRRLIEYFYNAESSLSILRGAPVVLAMNGTGDGVNVINSITAGVNKSMAYFVGVAMEDIPAGKVGPVLIHGVANFVRCSGAVAVETALSVNPAASNFVGGATVATIIAVASVGPSMKLCAVNAVATATVDGVTNVSTRVMINGL